MSAAPGTAVIVTADDPTAGPVQAARLTQIAGLYRRAGLTVDAVIVGTDWARSDPARALAGGRRLAIVPADPGTAGGALSGRTAGRVYEALAALREAGPVPSVVHLDGVILAPARDLGAAWVFDARDGTDPGQVPGDLDLVLAAHEALRRALARDRPTVRLPYPVPARPHRPGAMLGWVGPIDAAAAERWSALLDMLAGWGHHLTGGLLLAGPGAEAVRVPRIFQPHLVQETEASPGAHRALALAVLASDGVAGQMAHLSALLAGAVPVVTAAPMAEIAEDRWHLPVADGPRTMAEIIARWAGHAGADDLSAAAERTRAAHLYDQAAMAALFLAALPLPADATA